jgi:hypothetical protein
MIQELSIVGIDLAKSVFHLVGILTVSPVKSSLVYFISLAYLILQRTFNMVAFCSTISLDGGQKARAYDNGACAGVAPAGH